MNRLYNKCICIFLVVILVFNSFAAVVSDNDGSAFITKAEFDSLKNDFQSQLDQYNTSIDSKIDNAIASYLAGIKTEKVSELTSLLNRCNDQTKNNRDNRFINSSTIVIPSTQKPTSSKYSFLAFYTHGVYPNDSYKNMYDLIRWGTSSSVNAGRQWHNVSAANNNFYGLALSREYDADTTYYWHFNDKNIYSVTYVSYIVGNTHYWDANACSPSTPTSYTAAKAETSDTRWCSAAGQKYDWAAMRKDITVRHQFNAWNGIANNTADQIIQWSQYYQKSILTDRNSNFIGYCYGNLADSSKIYYMDTEKWYEAVDSGTTSSNSSMYGALTYRRTDQTGNGSYLTSATSTMTWYEYFHDIKQMNVNALGNYTATNVLGLKREYVRLYEGLPLCKATQDGTINIKISAECYNASDSIYTGAWTGKLYLRDDVRFINSSTTTSQYKDKDGNDKTDGITISNTNKDISFDIKCKAGNTYWVKYILDTSTSGLKIKLTSTGLKQESKTE